MDALQLLVQWFEYVLSSMKLARLVPHSHALACHHWYHACAPIVRPDAHSKLFRHRVYKVPFPANTLSERVREKRVVTFLIPTLVQERMVQCLPRSDTLNRLRVQQLFEQIERLFYVRFVILNIQKSRLPVRLT